jgi:hypothetical protein
VDARPGSVIAACFTRNCLKKHLLSATDILQLLLKELGERTAFALAKLASEFLIDIDFAVFVVTITYPILDLMLIIPSAIILVSLRKDYQHSIPWFLSSLSLLVNAIADDGYM